MPEVDGRTRSALTAAETTRDQVRITAQLDPDLWKSVAKVLTTLGGVYKPNRSAFAFTFDPRPTIQQIGRTGRYINPVSDEGYVPTPAVLAEELTTHPYSDLGRMPAGSRVLEPSAGDGALVRAILDANDTIEVVALEPNVQRFPHLPHEGQHDGRVTAIRTTFEEYAATHAGERFDGVVMNPPFAVPGQPTLWIDHVMLAWNMLEPGGRLVAVTYGNLAHGTSKKITDMRQLASDFGGWRKLPPDTFDRGVQTCVLWLTRPVPGQEGRPSYLFRHYPDHIDPVPVTEPWLTTRAVQEAPVQVWQDPWDGRRERVLRYRAQCWSCGWLLWEFDGRNDMSLGEHSSCSSLAANEYGKAGLSVGLCLTCANTSETHAAAVEIAHTAWDKPPSKAAAVSVWSLLLNRGGMIPVDDLERERYARVQAAMRDVFGVPEHASEAELIEAREAKPWRGGPDRLAAKYLTEYADRLDPDGDLDDADRAALLWRTDPDAPPVALAEEPNPWTAVLEQLEIPLGI